MAQPYITIEAPSATELAELVDDVPIRDNYIEEQLGGGPSITIHSAALDDPEDLMDDIVVHSSVRASMISID